ncbi:MAG: hypothetical protein ABSG81_08395 [Acidimicrobiales bacterium]
MRTVRVTPVRITPVRVTPLREMPEPVDADAFVAPVRVEVALRVADVVRAALLATGRTVPTRRAVRLGSVALGAPRPVRGVVPVRRARAVAGRAPLRPWSFDEPLTGWLWARWRCGRVRWWR